MANALIFPYALADFADLLKIQSVQMKLQRNDQIDGLENGQILAAEIAPPLFSGTVNIASLSYDEDSEVSALIDGLDGSIQPFYLYAPPRLYPQYDPTGSKLGAATITITAIDPDNKRLTLSGFPAGYTLMRGDRLSFDFGGAANLRAFHRIVSPAAVVADGNGAIQVEIRPHIHPGTVTGIEVTLIKPAAKVIMVPDSYNEGEVRGQRVTGKSFQVIQRF